MTLSQEEKQLKLQAISRLNRKLRLTKEQLMELEVDYVKQLLWPHETINKAKILEAEIDFTAAELEKLVKSIE